MSEGDDQGTSAADIDCAACARGVPAFLHEEALELRLERHGSEAPDARAETLCGDCATEVRELTDEMAHAEGSGDESPCGLCRRPLGDLGLTLHLRAGGAHEDETDTFHLCGTCDDVFVEFLGNVPEQKVTGALYEGDGDTTDRETVVRSVDLFDSLRIGDTVSVESRVAAKVGTPAHGYERSGTVEGRSEIHGIAHVHLATGDGEVRLTRPAPTIDRLTLQSLDGDVDHLGTVTSLTVDSRAPREAETADDGSVVELDADSALVPDSLDLESSAD
jgi:hypothetical protein